MGAPIRTLWAPGSGPETIQQLPPPVLKPVHCQQEKQRRGGHGEEVRVEGCQWKSDKYTNKSNSQTQKYD